MRDRGLVIALALVCAGCPRPLGAGGRGAGAVVPPDATVVLAAPTLQGLQELSNSWLPVLGATGRPLAGLGAVLASVGADGALTPETARLAGLAPDAEVHVSWRPTGDVVIALPVANQAAATVAMELLLAGNSGEAPERRGPTLLFRQAGEVVLAATPAPGAVLLAPRPVDVEGTAALLAAMARGDTPAASVQAPLQKAAALTLAATAAGLQRVLPGLVEMLPGDEVTAVSGALRQDGPALRITLDVAHAAAGTAPAPSPPLGFCALLDEALLVARFPSAWVAGDSAGPGQHLRGEVAVAIFKPAEAGGAPRWVALSRPRDADAIAALNASLVVEGGVVSEGELGGHAVKRVRAGNATGRVMVSVVEPELFMLASGEPPQLRAALEGRAACGDESMTSTSVWARLSPPELERVVRGVPEGTLVGGADPVAALARVASRLDMGAERLELSVSLGERTSVVKLALWPKR